MTASSPVRCNLCDFPVPPDQPVQWRKDGFDIVRCGSCGLVFRRELPTADEVLAIYGSEYFKRPASVHDAQGYDDYVEDEPSHRLTARRRLRRLSRHHINSRLLDVGAASGFLLDEARRAGWEVEGIDVSPQMVAWARERLGLPLRQGLFQGASFEPGVFDCVAMWDYIEHSIDPAGDLSRANELLRPGGILAISTGDIATLVARLSGRRWHLLTPRHHNFFFSRDVLADALRRRGFEILSSRHPAAWYTVHYLVYKVGTMVPHALTDGLARRIEGTRIGEAAVPVNLGDIVTIHARKQRWAM